MSRKAEKHMPFGEHLAILRRHIIRSLGAILAITTIAFLSKQFIFHTLILGPTRPEFWTYRMLWRLGEWLDAPALCLQEYSFTLQSRRLTSQFTMHVFSSLVVGLLGASPYILWETWRFVKPAVPINQHPIVCSSVVFVGVLLLLGTIFGYYIITPLAIHFLANYQLDPSIVNSFDLTAYVSTVVTLVLACALLFQLPVVIYLLARGNLVTASSMRTYRRHAIVAILCLAAIITPPDVMSQLLIAAPLWLLYEFSILIVQLVNNKEKTR